MFLEYLKGYTMDTRKQMRSYIKNVKTSMGYIPKRHIFNAYGVELKDDYTNIEYCINDIRKAILNKPIWKFS